MAASSIGIVLLAAGNSSRMGKSKQLLPYHGTTLLRHAARTAIATGFAPVVVVLGAEAERCRAEIADLPVHPIVNLEWEKGMGTSIRAGIAELVRLAPEIEAALILLHDQPLVSVEKLQKLAGAWKPGNCAVASAYGGAIGVPALFARELFGELRTLPDDQGARRILEAHRKHVIEIEMPEALHDIDTPEDYQRSCGQQ